MPLYGHELSESINPYQAGLGWAVKLHKGDFIGKAALQELANSPPPTRRVGLELPGKRAARDGSSILLGDRPIGTVTSGSYAPSLNRSIAMGYVESQAAAMGTQVQVDVRGSLIPAVVVKLPFYQRLSPAQ
jgi:aminomethyltransferase